MKRYLIYLAIVAVSSSLFLSTPIPTGQSALADTTKPKAIASKSAQSAPAPTSAVAAAPAAAPTVKAFNPNDQSTWPTCGVSQYVRADNGQCADNSVNAPSTTAASYTAAPSAVAIEGCGDNSYANYIYSHESGCRLTIQNSEGCIGIGQACPASKLTSVCPNLDYACENSFFTGYANSRYGGWAGAYNFWVNNHWW